MKRRTFLLTVLCLLLAASFACAESYLTEAQVKNIPFSRIQLEKPDGMAAHLENTAPGHVTIVIDTEATDWHKVALSDLGFGVRLNYLPPEASETSLVINNGYLYGGAPGGSFTDKLNIIQSDIQGRPPFEQDEPHHRSNGYSIGAMDQAHLTFIPENQNRSDYTLLCWGDFDCEKNTGMKENSAAGYAKRYYEQVVISVRHTSLDLVSLPNLNYATTEMLAPMASVRDYLACEMHNGELILKLPNRVSDISAADLRDQPNGQVVVLPLRLNAPSGAARVVVTGDTGGEADVISGVAEIDETFFVFPETMVEEFILTVSWLDENGASIDNGLLRVSIEPCTKNLFPSYVEDWSPVPPARVNLFNSIKDLGVEAVAKEDGAVYITRDHQKAASGNDGVICATVTAPSKDLKYYRIVSAGGSVIYGTGKQYMVFDQIDGMDMQTVKPNGQTDVIFESKPLRRYKNGPVDVYFETEEHFPYGGGAWVIYWYDSPSATEPVCKEYLCQITGKMYDDMPVELAANENQVPAPVDVITAVQPHGVNWKDWRLVIRSDPQPLLDTRHYELSLVNETGAYRALSLPEGKTLTVYFPYPEGLDMTTDKEFRLHHYNSGYVRLETLMGEKTARGIRYELTSLSPFVLDWSEEALPPKTGDSTPLAALLVLAARSCRMAS